ncbi:MAG: hypothetical protein BWY76_02234 [bacterium ADurb.Bin429]|nr:MAG: hypothetical protein BWY76_02234 [bacterium ADurb.Bin429]
MVNIFPLRCQASYIARQSGSVVASGFSQKTCFPASKAATVCAAWAQFHEPIITQSIAGSVTSAS